ncbi:MAG: GldG family protein [Deltaproteobacteria bacterium]|nr:GldG family protein [Deltaproteobacteria bacterium]
MRGWLQISGLIGLALTFFGLIAYLFSGNLRDAYVAAHWSLGAIFLLVYLTTQGRTLIRSLGRRATRRGLQTVFYSLLFLGILVTANFFNLRHHTRWDLTEAGIHTLSSQSAKVLERLERDVEIYGFFDRGEHPAISALMKRYTYLSPRIKFHPIDPDRHPELAQRFHIEQLGALHVRYGQESINITDPTEEAVTNAIARLTRGMKKTVYFLTGHGEPKTSDRASAEGYGAAKEALENENYRVEELLLAAEARIPGPASLLIVAGPHKPLLDHELQALEEHVKGGGRLLILLPSRYGEGLGPGSAEGLGKFLQAWGVAAGDDLVVDQVVRLFAGPSLGIQPIVEAYSPDHPITRNFKERTIFPMVRSVEPAATAREGAEITSLVKTSPSSWAEKNLAGIFKDGKAALGPEDKKGPVSVGVAASINLKKAGIEKEGEGRLVVLGTAEFANNRFLELFFNRDFFLNAVNWLGGEDAVITIRQHSLRPSRLQLTEAEGYLAFYLGFLIVPEIALLIGLSVWWKRR